MKKNTSIKLFNILARRVYKNSKKKGLGLKWTDAQKWTSAYLFKRYKGSVVSKLKLRAIDDDVHSILESGVSPMPPAIKPKDVFPVPTPKPVEVCYNPLLIPSVDLEDINWWLLPDTIDRFDNDLKIAIEIDGIINTGIVKKGSLPDLVPVREELRRVFKDNYGAVIIFKILTVPNYKDDGDACSYFVLATLEGSNQDMDTEKNEINIFTSKSSLTEEDRAKKEEAERKRKEEEMAQRTSKRAIKQIERPSDVEPTKKTETKKKTTVAESKRIDSLNETLRLLRKDYDDGIISKREYSKRQQIILDKFEKGGAI